MKQFASLCAQLALFWSPLCAQPQAPRPEVRGSVTEPGSNQPIPDATITVYLRPEPAPKILINGGFKDVYLTTKTGNDGSFSFTVERYGVLMIKVAKDGFRGAAMFEPPIDQANLTLDAEHPIRDVALHLTRPGAITGRVIDEETRKPLPKVKLGAYQADYQGGRRRFLPGAPAVETDGEGKFTISNLSPTDFVIVVRPHSQEDGRIVTNFEPADVDIVDRELERTWWPGGRDEELAIPVPVGSGQVFDIGQIAVRKAPLYRAKVTLERNSCAPGEMVRVALVTHVGFFTNSANGTAVPCGAPFLITRLAAGTYWVEAQAGTARASVPIDIRDKNVEARGALAPGVDIELRIAPTPGSRKADWSGVRLMFRPYGRAMNMADIPGSPDVEGRLRLVNVDARHFELRFSNLPAGFYVKEVLYNGAVMPFATLTPNSAAIAHKVEVVVDDKPAAVAGETRPGARVVLARWPITTPDPRSSLITTDAGEDGKYQITGLAPIEYRIFAIPADRARQLDRPGVLDGFLQSAKKLTLSPNATQTQNLDLP
jgi:hypothetical protein